MYRDISNSESRATEFLHTIDPGFVNRRLAQTVLTDAGMKLVDQIVCQIPPLPVALQEMRINHAYSQVLLALCQSLKVKTLGELLASGNGHLFCSTEQFLPSPKVYTDARVQSIVSPPGNTEYSVILEYSTAHILSDTLRMELDQGAILSTIAKFRRKEDNTLYFHPLVMGGPWMSHEDEQIAAWAMWTNLDHFENFVEDFDEFKRVLDFEKPSSIEPMKDVSEAAFKECLANLLGDSTRKDWGGETSDHFTSQLHLSGRRITGAFLLKGPSRFQPMTLNHLGKNNDQIYRLSQEPADVFFVQHSHEIEPAVRATLRAFAVQPGRPRRYCLIDGRDSLWLLQSYGLYDEAVGLSKRSG